MQFFLRMKRSFVPAFIACFLFSASLMAQNKKQPDFHHVEPPNWWIGMKNTSVQILFHNAQLNIASYKLNVNYEGVSVKEVKTVENPHYLFVTLDVSPSAKAGKIPFTFTAGKKTINYQYEIKNKSAEKNRIQGFNSSDVLYLIMPDRFANGDPKNDSIPGMFEGVHRDKGEKRHGGDLKGISDHLDYIKNLGVTAIWLNPVLENNQHKSSYHGYAITDLYNVDRRFGGNTEYISFINKSHESGMKVVQDMVMNHIGNDHWLVLDAPEKDWVNQWPEFTRSNYQGNVISDPYQSKFDADKMSNGWFDTTMPDVNQRNPLFATYLIQNTLWWIEHAGIDGIRMDTHPYPDKDFMSRWCKEVLEEYPSFNIVGEVWINSIANTAYWQKGMINKDGYQSNLPTVTDFPFYFTIEQAFNEGTGWDTGMRRLHTLLSQDYLYPNPNHNLIFLDNHDLTRTFRTLKRDVNKLKMALTFMLTTRGIPQLYYGTELLMDGDGGHHPNVRLDVPGGWAGDKTNAFTREGRTAEQNDMYDYMSKLMMWRKGEKVIHNGKLTHYIPEDNIYVYFRYDDAKTVMVVLNANTQSKTLDTARFKGSLASFKQGRNVITGETVNLSTLSLPASTAWILELK